MSGKLDQSLEDITKTRRSANRTSRRGGRNATVAKTGPTSGVTKNSRATKKNTAAVAATVPLAATGEGKIIVSGLPTDVTEVQIKDYFAKTIGGVKKVFLTYGPNGQSRGIATITFVDAQKASKTAKELNGVKVDNRPMKTAEELDIEMTDYFGGKGAAPDANAAAAAPVANGDAGMADEIM
ncbi:hypothetical protein FH972_022413 [Carpinus fangiana]|uniref:RRM domain-containing protein n=1 Tax=Carpinus fangiana TaxID=176857 RepID=A0A5N6KSQ7_9ROSI|nr:hypothetical protein FH972_022413 [Carpinus fangiana]